MRVVIKVGSSVLTENGKIAKDRMLNLVSFISELKDRMEVILVTSGAVASGYTSLKLDKNILSNKQALASIGQPLLMANYSKKFEKFGVIVSQLLLTAEDFDSRSRTQYAKDAIDVLLAHNVLPIINENDATATEELVFGDNDRLSAHIAYYFGANLLVILTDIDGYYDKNPREFSDAKMLKVVDTILEEDLKIGCNPNDFFATGGIATKLLAADFLLKRGKDMFLCSGFDLESAKEFLLNNIHIKGTLLGVYMFNVDGDVLNISLGMDLDEVYELKEFVQNKLEYIEAIGLEDDNSNISTSALLQLLISIKKSKPSIKISIFEEDRFVSKNFGVMNWVGIKWLD